MPWKTILRVALMLGLDKWAEQKAAALIRKGLDKLHRKAEAIAATVPDGKVTDIAAQIATARALVTEQPAK
jgi:hypothetical protein